MIEIIDSSLYLMSYFNDLHMNYNLYNKNVKKIIEKLYNQLEETKKTHLNKIKHNDLLKINFQNCPKPEDFNYIIPEIRKDIKKMCNYTVKYNLKILDRVINIFFIIEKNDSHTINMLNRSVKKIYTWLYVLINYYSTIESCSKTLNIYLYYTDLIKNLPEHNHHKINKYNVNTGFTTTCDPNSNIVIYRKEEWYKVFIHETIHNFGLDFSNYFTDDCKDCILNIFNVNSIVNLYEAYTDFWAVFLNAIVTSYFITNNFEEYIVYTQYLINMERKYSIFQVVKILDFIGMEYKHLYLLDGKSKELKKKYYEKTNVLAYYVIKSILLNDYEKFIEWCIINNDKKSILQFTNDRYDKNQIKFCNFINEHYETKDFLNRIDKITNFYKKQKENKNKENKYLLSNMRKSITEIN